MLKKYLASAIFLAVIITLSSCDKNDLYVTQPTPLNGEAQVKIIFASVYQKNPAYQIKINDVRVSNLLGGTATTTSLTPFPGGGLNTGGVSSSDYLAVKAGQNTVSFATPFAGTNNDSTVLASVSVNLESRKSYSLFFTDTLAKTTLVTVEDSLSRPDSGYAKYQFVNLMPDLPALDLYIGTVKVASDIPYKGVSPSFVLPTNNPSTIWAIRTVGGTTNLTTYTSASSISNQRVYTVFARGYNSITATNDYRRRAISLIYLK